MQTGDPPEASEGSCQSLPGRPELKQTFFPGTPNPGCPDQGGVPLPDPQGPTYLGDRGR